MGRSIILLFTAFFKGIVIFIMHNCWQAFGLADIPKMIALTGGRGRDFSAKKASAVGELRTLCFYPNYERTAILYTSKLGVAFY